ncbi:MAG: class II D-tagatose-bisphosphate aldolase non-catalytic subunit [Kiritimatiellia bacterium]
MRAEKIHPLQQVVRKHGAGETVGIYCLCTTHPFVLESAMIRGRGHEGLLWIESTANQVNLQGGYSGMTPAQFACFVVETAERVGLEPNRIVLGGDHLGPHLWRSDLGETAMERAYELVRACVEAGYTKLHLDASQPCRDDPQGGSAGSPPLELVADRTARLCAAAEEAADRMHAALRPVYVVGSDVPPPGGAKSEVHQVAITSAASVKEVLEATERAFSAHGLETAWERVVAVVVQPGIEFGATTILDYDREKVTELARFVESYEGLVYEAHSTDYQTTEALRQMVEDHFAILKVGPWLTFAFREAVLALEAMEREMLGRRRDVELSRLSEALEQAMLENPSYWQDYYGEDIEVSCFARRFGFSDRVRYYWSNPRVQAAVARLLANLEANPIPLPLLSFYLPEEYHLVRTKLIPNRPRALIRSRISAVLTAYDYACGPRSETAEKEGSDESTWE